MSKNKTYTSDSFFKELSFWLWPSMSKARIKEYTKAFEDFFARGKMTGSSDEKLIQTIGEPRPLAKKLVSEDGCASRNPLLKLAIGLILLISGGVFYCTDLFATSSYSWVVYLAIFGLILPLGITVICGTSIFTHTQWNKDVKIRIASVGSLSIALALATLFIPYSKFLFGVYSILSLVIMLFQMVFMMKDGAVMLPTMLLSSEVLTITSSIKSVYIRYAGMEQFDVIFSTTKWQILPLLIELLLFCGMLMIGWQYLLYRKKTKSEQENEQKSQ